MLNTDQIYQITDIPGYSPEVGRLLSMMNYARHTTLQAVEGLQRQQLDHLLDPESNSIGVRCCISPRWNMHTRWVRLKVGN